MFSATTDWAGPIMITPHTAFQIGVAVGRASVEFQRPVPTVRSDMRRRTFLCVSPLCFLGTRAAVSQSQTAAARADLREELSEAEIEIVRNSAMAKDLDNFFGKGFS
jgi:hypothetical protein